MEAAREAGADGSFVEAPGKLEDLREIGRNAPKPLVANMIEGGKTPVLSKAELVQMGFSLIVYPLSGLFSTAKALEHTYQKLLAADTTLGQEEHLMLFDEFNELIGVDRKFEVAGRFGVGA